MKQCFLALTTAFLAMLALSACSTDVTRSTPVEAAALERMAADGFADATITNMVEGNPAVRGADELYCVATDATTQNGQLPYLLVVWRIGDQWQAAQLTEGYYEWDLQGCPR